MTQWQGRSHRKVTGGLLRKNMKKKKYMRGRDFIPTHIGENRKIVLRTKGGGQKIMTRAANTVNVFAGGKIQKAKIISVKENPADLQFVRRNIITKGAVLETDIGNAKVTSRPNQHGIVNAVLVEKKALTAKEEKKKK